MRRRSLRAVLGLAAVLLVFAPGLANRRPEALAPAPERSPLARLLGPMSELVARLQWLRVQRAVLEGRSELALARAESALRLDPTDTEGWRFAGAYLGLDLASPNREPDGARRLALLEAGLEVLERGEARSSAPETLALWRGILLLTHAEIDPELRWPGGRSELWLETARAFERAAELGSPQAGELARTARARARRQD